jgi:hypothetical protein
MIKERKGDVALRVCDECGHEQWVSYWNIYKKNIHVCRNCSCKNTAKTRAYNKELNPWNKGKLKVGSHYLNSSGYYEIWIGPDTLPNMSGGYYREHRLMAEVKIGRPLSPKEKVHHIDGDKTNNTFDNLYVCSNHADHRHVHSQLERLSMELVKEGLIHFNHKEGQYELDPFLREQVRKSGELLGTPTAIGEDNQQRSFRDMSHEERSTTIQKWSTLKRVEAPDTLVAQLVTGDDIVSSAE